MRLLLRLAYVGTRYQGWQIQAKGCELLTIQGQLEQQLAILAGAPVRAFCCGRTDSGVHAIAQYVHCDIPDARGKTVRDWRRALNAMLPRDIRVLEAGFCRPDFHVRIDAISKTYRYRFWQERAFVPPATLPFVWQTGPLDACAMREGMGLIAGRHDFASLANAGTPMEDTVREILDWDLSPEPQDPLLPYHLPCLALTVTGTGFLKQMVRNIAGLLADLGKCKLAPLQVPGFLAAKNRKALPSATAPAQGLSLIAVRYKDEVGEKA